jgi:uncharacterized protein (DUF169 family)
MWTRDPAPKKYCVVKPLSLFTDDETPELVIFFSRPESLSGLHQLATFITNDPEVVASPWSAGCGSIAAWPLHYLNKGVDKAVIGGWDPSARKFFKNDELSFTVPFHLFVEMVNRYKESFLMEKHGERLRKRSPGARKSGVKRGNKCWGSRNSTQT